MSKRGSPSVVSEEAFTEIFQSMSEGLIMVDEAGEIVVSNPTAEQIFGYEKNGLIGVPMEELLPQRFRQGHMNLRKGFNASPIPRRMGMGRDLVALRKDGTEFSVEVSLSFTKLDGKLLVMAFISDITQRKNVQDALKRSEEQLIVYASELEKKVQMRTEALNNIVDELEKEVLVRKRAEEDTKRSLEKERELNELKSRFVSLASHEFRTPLSTILSSASLVAQYQLKGDHEKIDKHLSRIKSNIGHLTAILNDFLSLGKLEEGKVEVSLHPIDVTSFFIEIQEELKPLLKEGQKIVMKCLPPTKVLKSDAHVLRNIVFNLISNASKYSAEGKPITIRCYHKGQNLFIDILDEGIGIPTSESKHIFERFFRASNASNIQGTGLGLNIVKRYIELLNGEVKFTSKDGQGSCFTVILPLTNQI